MKRVAGAGAATGLHAIALFEGAKGVLVLVAGCGLLALVHRDAQSIAEEIVQRFHLNPAHHNPRVLIDAATHINDARLRLLALAALLYSAMRFVEAYGLWRHRTWAEWFAIVSGGVYLPVEIYELVHHATTVKAVVLLVNASIVASLLYYRLHSHPLVLERFLVWMNTSRHRQRGRIGGLKPRRS